MATSTEPTHLKKEEEEEDDSKPSVEEDTGAQVAPIVKLQEVAVSTGEENEDVLLDLKSKLYRFDKEGSQWKERGVGVLKLLKHKETGKVRIIVRQSKTLKICANHLVVPTLVLQEHQGNEKSCVWNAADFADGELKDETFCIRFPSIENCKAFKDKIVEITESMSNEGGKTEEANAEVTDTQSNVGGETEEANAAAELIGKLNVNEQTPEGKEASTEKKDDSEK